MSDRPVLIANASGFYGDRGAAWREMVDGGPIDVLTGDYLAELTMLILWKARAKDASAGWARSALGHLETVLGTCLDRGIRIVTNAGGLNPGGLAEQVVALGERLGLHPSVAYVTGDDLMPQLAALLEAGEPLAHLDTGEPFAARGAPAVTANAYLGGWGITGALLAGADVVVCPRVTDASLVVGPAAWWHGWSRTDWDALAGAVVAGHVIECGPQATGGNYSFLAEITDRRYPGFPIAEVAADGSSVITKHPDTGGLVSVGTVTAQLLYEIGGPAYANPDVVAHFDTVRLEPVGEHRVRLSGTTGSPPPPTAKVAINVAGGFRNTMTMVLTGLDVEERAAYATDLLFGLLGGREQFAETDVRLLRFDTPDAPGNEQATAHLRVTVKDPDADRVGRRFSNALVELALAGYAGFHTTTPPTTAGAYGVFWPTLVPVEVLQHQVVLPDGTVRDVPPTSTGPTAVPLLRVLPAEPADAPTTRAPLGLVCGARSGDKGGNANVGLWVRDPAAYPWLRSYLTVDRFRGLLTEARDLRVERHELPNLGALNFVVVGLLGEGVASSTRPDPQAKGLGEYLRSRRVDVPTALLGPTGQ